jgi:hypothetical protein
LPEQGGVVVVPVVGVVGSHGPGAAVVVVVQRSSTGHPVTACVPQSGFAGGIVGAGHGPQVRQDGKFVKHPP